MMQQARSNNKVLEHLMRKKIKGDLPGVLGRLVNTSNDRTFWNVI